MDEVFTAETTRVMKFGNVPEEEEGNAGDVLNVVLNVPPGPRRIPKW